MTSLLAQEQLDFASQMCSRLCHDLISPVGAISNGLEILAEETDADMRAQVIDLLHQSAQVTAAKLRYYRLAFGAPGGLDGAIDVRELKSTVEDFMLAGKADLEWRIQEPSLPKSIVKLLMIGIMTASDALVRGGTVVVHSPEPQSFQIAAQGPKVVIDEDVRSLLTGAMTSAHETSRYAPLVLFLSVLNATAMRHHLHETETDFVLNIAFA